LYNILKMIRRFYQVGCMYVTDVGNALQEQRRLQSVSGMHLIPNATLTLQPISKALDPASKQQQGSKTTPRAAGAFLARQSSEGEGLIPVGHYGGEAAAAAAAAGGDASSGVNEDGVADVGEAGGVAVGVAGCSRPLLDVGFENLSMSLKSCGKQVLQGISGRMLDR
jgi:hypothetical protein